MKILVIGGVAAGTKAAAKLKREQPDAQVVLYTKGQDISYAGCGLPYYVGGSIETREELIVNTPWKYAGLTRVEVHTGQEATALDAGAKTVTLRDTATGTEQTQGYDKLILAVGAEPFVPDVPGTALPGVFRMRTPDDAIAVRDWVDQNASRRAVVREEAAAKKAEAWARLQEGEVVHGIVRRLTDFGAFVDLGGVDGLSLGLCGDLKNGRTVHSLIKAMAKFKDIKFFLISPRELAVPEYMRTFMRENNMRFTEVTGLEAVIPQLDVLYMTRIQRERFVDPLEYERNKGIYILTRRKLERAKEKMLVMHPLPRVDEITVDVDDDPRAAYFEQATNGVYMRMALIMTLLGLKDPKTGEVAFPC